jgi:hypothetical protein
MLHVILTLLLASVSEADEAADKNLQELFQPINRLDEVELARKVRQSIEKGANPLTHLPPNMDKTLIEVAIIENKPLIVEALFEPPSPISCEALEERIEFDRVDARRIVDIFRTRIARLSLRSSQNIIDVTSGESVRIFKFADEYIGELSLMILYLMMVFLLVLFLYNLRIKQFPYPDNLMSPKDSSDTWLGYLRMSISTLATSVPVTNIFETIGYGLGLVGGIIWSYMYTNRKDVGLLLILISVCQSIFTLTCYLRFAPSESSTYAASIQKQVMMYPKKTDWNRATIQSCCYLLSCSASYFILMIGLNPVHRMYDCPSRAVSDTYGFDYSLTRCVSTMWDIMIFFTVSLRIFRILDTIIVFELLTSSSPKRGNEHIMNFN